MAPIIKNINLGEEPKSPTHVFKPSKYQQALFDWIVNGSGSAIVEAVAGSGKTTSIVQALNLIPESKRAIFLAFNRSIAEELKSRVPAHATAATFHSTGLRIWKQHYPRCQVEERKIVKMFRDMMPSAARAENGAAVMNLVSLAKQRGIGCLEPNIPSSWEDLLDHFDLPVQYEDIPEIIEKATVLLDMSIETAEQEVDFDDMIYMPVLRNLSSYTYDWVFVDEAQDTNGVRRALAKMILASNRGRLVAVGDPHQAIYGFTGADSDAMDLIQEEFECVTLPLSICYRSSKRVVKEAQSFVPEIEASPTAPDGKVAVIRYADAPPSDEDVILCRNTAPLVALAYEFIAQGRGCKILGRDIGKGLVNLVNKMKSYDLEGLIDRLEGFRSRETDRLRKQDKEGKAQSVDDKVDCILTVIGNLSEGQRTIGNLVAHIEMMFQDPGKGLLTLSTVHKAKGLEWERVFLHRPDLIPSKWAKQPWQLRQETNLMYVAITRAKRELYYVEGGDECQTIK